MRGRYRFLKIGGAIFGTYVGLTQFSMAFHFLNIRKVNSWQMPQNNKTQPMQGMNNATREEIENGVISMFALKPNKDVSSLIGENCTFVDPVGKVKGKKAVDIVIFGLPHSILCKNHEMQMDTIKMKQFSNSFTLQFETKTKMIGLPVEQTIPTLVYVELNNDNTKITKIEDYWHGRPFWNGLGLGPLIRTINGKLIFGWYLKSCVPS